MKNEKKIKCVVWDLDGTVWKGVLMYGDALVPKHGIREVLEELDRRGILQSVASKNDHDEAFAKLKEFGFDEFFLYPRINWNSKATSIREIADALNIGVDTFAFVDDSKSEREEVSFHLPEVLVIDAARYLEIPDMDRLKPVFVTEDAVNRRTMYRDEIIRRKAETGFTGSSEAFLRSLSMELKIAPVSEQDLQRVEELTLRTSQMNATGYTYSYEELRALINSGNHIFLVAELSDRFGSYGKIGLVLLEKTDDSYIIKLLIMSCRVMSKGIGSTLLVFLIKKAAANRKKLLAEFLETDRNRAMYITYKFMGFSETERDGDRALLMYSSDAEREFPDYIKVLSE
ncbi:MAG: HAD-IIIC family phosphatase [Clostridiales Family XIII bacterium]|jgi:FkbH-like protein|nr:HAD-IIIC family phosphatase [Clostridiales Family XIII bacterium]